MGASRHGTHAFASAISKGKEINVFNNGDLIRDFTYVDDIVNGTIQVIDHQPEISEKGVPAKVYNIGCSHPVKLMDFISEIEKNLGIMAKKNFMPMQQGDVYQTNADTTKLEREVGYCPSVRLPEGIARFVEWYQSDKIRSNKNINKMTDYLLTALIPMAFL